MIKCEVIKKFNYKNFKNLENVVRIDSSKNKAGELYVGDTFECDKEIASYLSGKNPIKEVVIKVIEVEPKKEIKEEIIEAKPKTTKKKKKK